MFSLLSKAQQAELVNGLEFKKFQTGEVIKSKGEIYLIKKGRLRQEFTTLPTNSLLTEERLETVEEEAGSENVCSTFNERRQSELKIKILDQLEEGQIAG